MSTDNSSEENQNEMTSPVEEKRPARRVVTNRTLMDKQKLKEQAQEEREQSEVDEQDPSVRELAEVLESNDLVGGSCRLERRGPMENGFSYICKMKTSLFDIEQIKRMYGGGDYTVQFFRANGQMAKKVPFAIDARFTGIIDKSGIQHVSQENGGDISKLLAQAVIADKRSDPAQAQMFTAMMKQSQDSSQLLITMMMKSQESQTTMMMGMMTAMAQAFGNGQKNVTPHDGLKVTDIVALIPLLKGNESAKAPSINEILDAVIKLKSLDGGSGGGVEPEQPQSLMDKLLAMAPHVANTVSALTGKPVPNLAPPALPAGAPATGPKAATPAAPASAGLDPIQSSLVLVIAAARRNADVGLYHDMFMDSITDDQIPMLRQVLTDNNWFATLFGNLTDAETIRPWLTKLRSLMLETMMPEPAAPVVTPPNGSQEPTGIEDSAGERSGQDSVGASAN